MSQLVFKFPFKTKYNEQDFYVSSNNFSAYKLIESWPNWPGKWLNIFGISGSGKTHLSKILEKKISKTKILMGNKISNQLIDEMVNIDCLIIDEFQDNINEKLLYSILNQSKQLESFILINTINKLKKIKFNLKDLKSRLNSFIDIGIDLPTDELLKVIITKSFSDKQINLDPKISEYIIKNVDRSYEKMFKFIKDVDDLSLSSGKSININLIKKSIKIKMNKYRSHNCSEIGEKDIDKIVTLSGWLHRKRDHGNLLFVDLRDHYGITQCVIENDNELFPIIEKTKPESVLRISGKVLRRGVGTENLELKTGKVEIRIQALEILSSAKELPIPVFGEQDYPEI